MTSQTSGALAGLFGGAQSQGALSPGALAVIDIHDIGTDIQNALGVSVDDVTASEVMLVALLVDDSGSIKAANNEPVVRDGHNLVLDSLIASKQKDGILAMCRYLNKGQLYAYMPVAQATRMDGKNFNATGSTPLYDESVTTLAAVIAKTQDFTDNGIACRTVTLIVSDGGDARSRRSSAADVKRLVDDMMRQECHIVAFMGIDDGGHTDFRAVAQSMGIRDEWILTPGNSDSEIRKAFAVFSQSAQRASQNAGSFSAAAMGGFATP